MFVKFRVLCIFRNRIMACGIRNSRLSEAVLMGYADRPAIDGLRCIVLGELGRFEFELACANLPLWSNLSELELYYDRNANNVNGTTSDYDSEIE